MVLLLSDIAAQENGEPPAVDLLTFSRNYINSTLDEDLGYKHLFLKEDTFKVWGWSKNGNIAYTIRDTENWRGAIITKAYIFNLVKDTVLWENTIFSDEYGDENAYSNAYGSFIEDFKNEIEKCGISFIEINYNNFPVIFNNNTINVKIQKTPNPGWDLAGEERSKKFNDYSVIAEKNNKRKTIASVTRPDALSVIPCGYFKSPFEDRALIVVAHFQYMLEGECWITFNFSGCHLTDGFK